MMIDVNHADDARVRFALTPQEQAGAAAVRVVVEAHRDAGRGAALDRATLQRFFAALAPTGYLGSTLSRRDGGAELSPLAFGALVEALAPEFTLLGNHSVQRYLAEFGSDALKAEHLPPLLGGTGIGAIAITEPHAGSDLAALQTTAVRQGDRWRLDGVKTWVTHGLVATVFIVLARTGEGFTRFVVPASTPGLSVQALTPIGLRHMTFAELRFDGCELADAARLGAEGQGAGGTKSAFPLARLLAALQSLRIAQAALAHAVGYARERTILGAPLARRELVADAHTRLSTQVEALRLYAWRALAQPLDDADTARIASAAKAAAADVAVEACRWAGDVTGSQGLDAADPIHSLSADARMMSVVDGTSVLNRLVAGRRALTPR